jgi:hypothetical protein
MARSAPEFVTSVSEPDMQEKLTRVVQRLRSGSRVEGLSRMALT